MPARIALVLPSFAGGGAERVMLTLAQGLDRARFAPHLILLDATGPLAPLAANLEVTALSRPRLRQAAPALIGALRCLGPAAILSTFGYVNLALAALSPLLPGAALILREANLPSRGWARGPVGRLQRLGVRVCYPRAARILCPSSATLAELCVLAPAARDKLVLLPNPVAREMLRRSAEPPRRAPGSGPRLVAAGRLTRQKGFDRLLRWFAAAPADALLTILGDGPERGALVAQAAPFAGRVEFAGHVAAPWAHYAGADAFLMPSRWEGMPNAALEALAVGTPVIATAASGGLADIVAEVAPGALTLAPGGRSFAHALAGVRASPPARLRPSLLPARFETAVVIAAFEAILDAAIARG